MVTYGLASHYMQKDKIAEFYTQLMTINKDTTNDEILLIVDKLSEPV